VRKKKEPTEREREELRTWYAAVLKRAEHGRKAASELEEFRAWYAAVLERAERGRPAFLERERERRKQELSDLRELRRKRNRAQGAMRRARLRNAPGNFTANDIAVMLRNQKSRCWWCGKPMGEIYTVDHRFALARGGTNEPSNIVLACRGCNARKHTKSPGVFAGRLL
jgi:5-methylcytosine-specific restriction endonuclease McrA